MRLYINQITGKLELTVLDYQLDPPHKKLSDKFVNREYYINKPKVKFVQFNSGYYWYIRTESVGQHIGIEPKYLDQALAHQLYLQFSQ